MQEYVVNKQEMELSNVLRCRPSTTDVIRNSQSLWWLAAKLNQCFECSCPLDLVQLQITMFAIGLWFKCREAILFNNDSSRG